MKIDKKYYIIGLGTLLIFVACSPYVINQVANNQRNLERDYDNHQVINNKNDSILKISSSTPVWSYSSGKSINTVAISDDSNYIVCAEVSSTPRLNLFSKSSNIPIWSYAGGSWYIRSVAISDDGSYIAAGGDDNKLYIFHKNSSTPLWEYTTGDIVWKVDISADGQFIIAGSNDKYTYFFDRSNSTPLWSYNFSKGVNDVSLSDDGAYAVAVSELSNRTSINVFNTSNTGSPLLWNYTTGGGERACDISGNGKYITAGGYEKQVYCFSTFNSTPLWNYSLGSGVEDVVLSDDGKYLAAGSYDPQRLYLFDVDNVADPFLWYSSIGDDLEEIAISNNGQRIAGCNEYPEDRVYLWNRESSTPYWYYTCGHNARTIDISGDGSYIVSGSDDQNLYLFYEEVSDNPIVSIMDPVENQWFETTIPNITYTAIDIDGIDTEWLWMSDGTTTVENKSWTGIISAGDWNQLQNGTISIRVYANDTSGNIGYDEVNVIKGKDNINPVVSISSPQANEWFETSIPSIVYTADDTGGINSIWLWMSDGTTTVENKSWTGIISAGDWNQLQNGTISIRVYANDTFGNIGYDEVNVIKGNDHTNPTWIEVPTDQTIQYEKLFSYDVNATDDTKLSLYSINNTGLFSIDSDGVITNATTLPVGTYWLNISVFDIFNNKLSTVIKITVIPPPSNGIPGYNISLLIVAINISTLLILMKIKNRKRYKN